MTVAVDLDIIDLRSWCRAQAMDGYRPNASGPGSEIDRPVAEQHHCARCGQACTYVAYRKIGSYRAIVACWPCNRGSEF